MAFRLLLVPVRQRDAANSMTLFFFFRDDNRKTFNYKITPNTCCLRLDNSLDCVDSVRPLPSPSPVSYTCSGDSETKFSPKAIERKEIKRMNWLKISMEIVKLIEVSITECRQLNFLPMGGFDFILCTFQHYTVIDYQPPSVLCLVNADKSFWIFFC